MASHQSRDREGWQKQWSRGRRWMWKEQGRPSAVCVGCSLETQTQTARLLHSDSIQTEREMCLGSLESTGIATRLHDLVAKEKEELLSTWTFYG
ncbi:hypothetical protein AOLI_G00280210 [Acnodon oligacanthus]